MMKNEQGRKLISCREAAEQYRCSMRWVRKLAQAGRIYSETVAGCYMVAEADVAKLKAKTSKGTGRHKPKADKFKAG